MKTNPPLLFNGDCTFLFGESYIENLTARYTTGTIDRFIELLAQSGVDIYLQNPNAQKPWYPSRILSTAWDGYQRGDREFVRSNFPPVDDTDFPIEELNRSMDTCLALLDRHLDLLEDDVDWVQKIAQACRRNHIKPWLSVRMNDAHGSQNWDESYFNCKLQQDPRFRLSGRQPDGTVNISEQLLDYRHPEVRDYFFAMIRELVEEYDYEGLELDWMRDPFCCEPQADQSTLDMMTEWVAQIRQLTRHKAEQTGRPFPLGLRLPVRLDALKNIGLDVAAFAREGLIDFIAPTNYWQTTWDVPYDRLRAAVGDKVAIYGVIEDAPNWLECRSSTQDTGEQEGFNPSHRCLSASPELLRGNAAGKLAQGANGIYLYNFFCTDEATHNPNPAVLQAKYPALQCLSVLDALRGKPKHYALATANDARMRRYFESADQLPVTLAPGDQRTFTISMCSEPAIEKREHRQELLLQVVIENTDEDCRLVAIFNGCAAQGMAIFTDKLLFPTGIFTHHTVKHKALNFRFLASDIKEGWNELLVFNNNESDVRILSLELAVLAELG